MRTAYIAIIGTREINLAGKTLLDILKENANGGERKTIRQLSQEILGEYAKHREVITAPILEPGIRQVLESLGPDGRIDSLLLFVTDQQDSKHRQSDTLHIGAILERRLPELFGNHIAKIESCSIPDDPSNYDNMYTFFARELRKYIEPRGYDRVWAAPVGGPPACTNGMILNVVDLYGENSRLIFVAENGMARTLDLQQTILQRFAREQARAFLSRRDFGALRTTMERAGLGLPELWEVCTYAERRLHFDFQGADEALKEATRHATDRQTQDKINQYQQSLQPLMQNIRRPSTLSTSPASKNWFDWQSRQITELYFNLQHKAHRGEWVDFLGRVYRLHEAGLRLMYERKEKKQTGGDTDDLRKWLEQQAKKEPHIYGSQVPRCLKLEQLKKIRNKSIMAHGYRGVSLPDLETALSGQDIQSFIAGDMRDYLAHPQIGANVAQNNDPLADVITLLQKALES